MDVIVQNGAVHGWRNVFGRPQRRRLRDDRRSRPRQPFVTERSVPRLRLRFALWRRMARARRLRGTMPEFRYRLGDEVHDLTTRTLVMGILNRTPDSFYDKGATFELDSLLQRGRACSSTQGADLLDVGGVKAGPGPEVDRGRGARPGGGPDRGAARALRRRHLVRHVAGVGARRGVQGRRGRRQRHQRLRRPRLPRGRAPATARRWSPPTSGCSRASPDPEPHYDDLARRRHRVPARPGAPAPRPPASPRSRSRSTPASTSARRRRRARCCCARATRWPRSATRCCCRRRTSGSSASCSSSTSTPAAPRRWRRSRTASPTAVASCGCTTSPVRWRCAAWSRSSCDAAAERRRRTWSRAPTPRCATGSSTSSSPSCSAPTTPRSRSRRSPSPARRRGARPAPGANHRYLRPLRGPGPPPRPALAGRPLVALGHHPRGLRRLPPSLLPQVRPRRPPTRAARRRARGRAAHPARSSTASSSASSPSSSNFRGRAHPSGPELERRRPRAPRRHRHPGLRRRGR